MTLKTFYVTIPQRGVVVIVRGAESFSEIWEALVCVCGGIVVMSISRILNKEMNKSGGSARLVKVPSNRRPTSESLEKLEREISAQVIANEAMRSRSMQNASKMSKW